MPDYVFLVKPLHPAPELTKNFLLELSHRVFLGHINLCIENLHFGCVLNLLYKMVTLSKLALMMTLTLTAAVGFQDHTDPS